MKSTYSGMALFLLFTASAPISAGVPCTSPTEPLGEGRYLKDVEGAVDDAMARFGPTAGYHRSRRTTWEEGGASMTFLIEDNGSEVLTVETWATAEGETEKYPSSWREYPVGIVQVGMSMEERRTHLEGATCSVSAGPGEGTVEECHFEAVSYYISTTDGGLIYSVEVRRIASDWEHAVNRRSWLDVLGKPIRDADTTQWSFTTQVQSLERIGDYLDKNWSVQMQAR
jgi:hypothetical protein